VADFIVRYSSLTASLLINWTSVLIHFKYHRVSALGGYALAWFLGDHNRYFTAHEKKTEREETTSRI